VGQERVGRISGIHTDRCCAEKSKFGDAHVLHQTPRHTDVWETVDLVSGILPSANFCFSHGGEYQNWWFIGCNAAIDVSKKTSAMSSS